MKELYPAIIKISIILTIMSLISVALTISIAGPELIVSIISLGLSLTVLMITLSIVGLFQSLQN